MDTFKYFVLYIRDTLQLKNIRESTIRDAIMEASAQVTGTLTDLVPAGDDGTLFLCPTGPVKDQSVTIYRATNPDLLTDPASTLAKGVFDYDEPGTWPAFTTPCQLDYGKRAIRFQTAIDPAVDYVFYKFLAVDKGKFDEIVISSAALTSTVRKEERSNVTIERRSLLDNLLTRQKLINEQRGGLTGEVVESTFGRHSNGELYGVDPETGEVI